MSDGVVADLLAREHETPSGSVPSLRLPVHRLERLRGAFEVASRAPVVVERAGAAAFLRSRLAQPVPGVLTVVWHSVVRQYLSPDERGQMDAVLAEAGAQATADAPLVRATTWPGGHEELLAECSGHGPPVRWVAPAS